MRSAYSETEAYVHRFFPAWVYAFSVLSFYELLFRHSVAESFSFQTAFAFYSAFFIAAGTACLISLFSRRFMSLCIGMCTFVWALSYAIQICYFGVFNTFASFGALLNGTQALTRFSFIVMGTIQKNKIYLLLMIVPLISAFTFSCWFKLKSFAPQRRTLAVAGFLYCFIYIFSGAALLVFGGNTNSPYIMYTEKKPVEDTVRILGVLPSFSLDIKRLLAESADPFSVRALKKAYSVCSEIGSFSKKEQHFDSLLDNTTTKSRKDAVSKTDVSGANIVPIDFESLIQNETDETLRSMDMYFASRTPDVKNAYTGMFKDKNLIYITAESFSPYAIREDLTPTLYKMMHQGFYFTHFYNPYWDISTTDGEYVNCLSLVPKSGTFSFKDSADNYLPFALGNQFRSLGYTTRAYHNYIGTYYDRNLSHPNMGYDFFSMGAGYRETEQWPDSDLEMMQLTLGDYIDDPHFHTYYMTISGHLPYNFWANAMAIRHEKDVATLPYEESIRAFYACNMELDLAMQYLLEQLEAKGIAQNTVIVIASDHYPYGLEFEKFKLLAGRKIDATFDLYESALIIYNPGQNNVQVDKYCCNMDILPTLSNLFALPYDSRLMMGHDIFSDSVPFMVFKSKNVMTDTLKYYSNTNAAVSLTGEKIPAEAVEAVKKTLADQIAFSALVLDTDYFRRILPLQ